MPLRPLTVLVAVTVALMLSGSAAAIPTPPRPPAAEPTPAVPTERTPLERAIDGLPQAGERLGRRDAPLTIELFADLQCPFCAEHAQRPLPRIVREWVASGRAQIRLRLLTFLGRDSIRAARAATAAGQQGRLWQFTGRFLAGQGVENSGYVTDDHLRTVAAAVDGLDAETMLAAARTDATLDPLRAADRLSQRLRVTGTPSVAIGRRGGPLTLVNGTARYRELDAALRALQRR